jgi:cell fate regulator YaaT (PSP1 superfamily)
MSERQTVVAVKLRYNPKTFWFDPALSTYSAGDHVLVDTERGREIGLVTDPALEVTKAQVKGLKSPLKPIIRALDEADFDRIDELDAKGKEAMPLFRELIEKHGLDMKPVSVEFLFSGEKAVFYFSHDERVDFRELVRDLASQFHIRVDMRQIGVRDEARIFGGLAHCGEELCCARLGGEFQPVSIRMAKEQDLPLNPSKISGACGRLMCCLRYEFEAYKDFKGRAPKKGAIIETPIGKAKVIDFDTPREIITMRLEDGKQLSVPLSEFDCPAEGEGKKRPCSISRDAIDRCASSNIIMALAALEQELAQKPSSGEKRGRDRGDRGDRGNRGGGGGAGGEGERDARRPRRAGRRAAGDGQSTEQTAERGEQKERGADGQKGGSSRKKNTQKQRPRPGQHSSGLRGGGDERSEAGAQDSRQGASRTDRAGRNRAGRTDRADRTDRASRAGRSANRTDGSSDSPARERSQRQPKGQPQSRTQNQTGEGASASRDDGRRRRRRRSGNAGGSGNAGSSDNSGGQSS